MKSEWAGSKLPDLQVLRPKGTGGNIQGTSNQQEVYKQDKHGEKRIWEQQQAPNQPRPSKRMRERSPEPVSGPSHWMEPPTFLTSEERDSRDKRQGPEAENQARSLKALEETQDPGHKQGRDSKTPPKASVRERRIDKKCVHMRRSTCIKITISERSTFRHFCVYDLRKDP